MSVYSVYEAGQIIYRAVTGFNCAGSKPEEEEVVDDYRPAHLPEHVDPCNPNYLKLVTWDFITQDVIKRYNLFKDLTEEEKARVNANLPEIAALLKEANGNKEDPYQDVYEKDKSGYDTKEIKDRSYGSYLVTQCEGDYTIGPTQRFLTIPALILNYSVGNLPALNVPLAEIKNKIGVLKRSKEPAPKVCAWGKLNQMLDDNRQPIPFTTTPPALAFTAPAKGKADITKTLSISHPKACFDKTTVLIPETPAANETKLKHLLNVQSENIAQITLTIPPESGSKTEGGKEYRYSIVTSHPNDSNQKQYGYITIYIKAPGESPVEIGPAPTSPVTNLRVTVEMENSCGLEWDEVDGASYYKVSGPGKISISGTTATITNLNPDKNHSFLVKPGHNKMLGEASTWATVECKTLPKLAWVTAEVSYDYSDATLLRKCAEIKAKSPVYGGTCEGNVRAGTWKGKNGAIQINKVIARSKWGVSPIPIDE